MIKLDKKPSGGVLKDPDNLVPMVFRCRECDCVIRKLEDTQSYVLMTVSKGVEDGTRKICPFCYRLRELRGVE